MAWDEALAGVLRAELAARRTEEKRMFGGLAFMQGGHMVCGLYRDRAFFRVGRPGEAAALAIPGVGPMAMGARTMPGMADCAAAVCADRAVLARLLGLALAFVDGLPPKAAGRRA